MRGSVRPWLPAEAAGNVAVRAAIEVAVADWSTHWFQNGQLALSGWDIGRIDRMSEASVWSGEKAGLQAVCSARASQRLAAIALDATSDVFDNNERDRSFLSHLTQRIVADLIDRLKALLGAQEIASGPVAERCFVATVSDGSDALLRVAIPVSHLIGICRTHLPRPQPAREKPKPILPALGATQVRLAATLGVSTLSLADLRSLAVGDVLVLDQALDQHTPVSFAGSRDVIAHGLLTKADGHVALILQSAE